MRASFRSALLLLAAGLPASATLAAPLQPAPGTVQGSLVLWGTASVDFAGPATAELAAVNPFLDLRLDVTFRHPSSGVQLVVPGYYAADGNAADSGASAGGVWRAHLLPSATGAWTYSASFRAGPFIATGTDPLAGTPTGFDGASGSFTIAPLPAGAQGFHRDGLLAWDGGRYLRFSGSGRPFVKTGTNSPENLLAYKDFDGTPASHAYAAHVADWMTGDPTWAGGRGKGLIGAINYLSGRGVNSAYFLSFNVGGDGQDVWPWTSSSERLRFDVSKLAQWERVFGHMMARGMALHVVLQETENDNGPLGLDGGELGTQRRLYHRELVARFAHHPALQWNLGEENGNTTAQLMAFYDHLRALDPYDHPIVVHTYPTTKGLVYPPLLAGGGMEGASMQIVDAKTTHDETLAWVAASKASGKSWAVSVDEIGPPDMGVVPDASDPGHHTVRRHALWGNLMAGGSGCEWYFGYGFAHDDLDCEDFRARAAMWNQSRHARLFLETHRPLTDLEPADGLVSAKNSAGVGVKAWCLAQPGQIYALYLPLGGHATLTLDEPGTYEVRWYDPMLGGELQTGTIGSVQGPGPVALGQPPVKPDSDWALLVRRVSEGNTAPTIVGVSVPSPHWGGQDFHVSVTVADADGSGDVAGVAVHFVAPGMVYVGYAPATKVSATQYVLAVPDLPALHAGTWYAVPMVVDQLGQVAWKAKHFTAL